MGVFHCPAEIIFGLYFILGNHHRFNPSQSSTYTNNGQTFSLSYGSGSLTVFLGYDTVQVTKLCNTQLTIFN